MYSERGRRASVPGAASFISLGMASRLDLERVVLQGFSARRMRYEKQPPCIPTLPDRVSAGMSISRTDDCLFAVTHYTMSAQKYPVARQASKAAAPSIREIQECV
jgi:hypothetical protein